MHRARTVVGELEPEAVESRGGQGQSMVDREAAGWLLTEFAQSESLRKHALGVEACMRACAGKFGGSYQGSPSGVPPSGHQACGASAPEGLSEEDLWGIVGLIHDFDYEKYPSLDDHPYKGNEILKQRG